MKEMKEHSICITIVTRNRPIMLQNLFNSLNKIQPLRGYDIRFLIVENNDVMCMKETVHKIKSNYNNLNIDYILEREIGISAARNRGLEYAIQNKQELLVFVDDDEYVNPDWLKNLLAKQIREDLDLVGSPVLPVPFNTDLSLQQRLVWNGISHRSRRSEERKRKQCNDGNDHNIKIATGSWMGRVAFFQETGLRFDTRFGLAGGEDWQLFIHARELGAKTGWAPDAIVYETIPPDRLSLEYQFRRERDHANSQFWLQYRTDPRRALLKLPLRIIGRAFKFIMACLAIPFMCDRSILSATKSLGGLVGLFQCCLGRRHLHYSKTSGA